MTQPLTCLPQFYPPGWFTTPVRCLPLPCNTATHRHGSHAVCNRTPAAPHVPRTVLHSWIPPLILRLPGFWVRRPADACALPNIAFRLPQLMPLVHGLRRYPLPPSDSVHGYAPGAYTDSAYGTVLRCRICCSSCMRFADSSRCVPPAWFALTFLLTHGLHYYLQWLTRCCLRSRTCVVIFAQHAYTTWQPADRTPFTRTARFFVPG